MTEMLKTKSAELSEIAIEGLRLVQKEVEKIVSEDIK